MPVPSVDDRSPQRRALDEQIAAEPRRTIPPVSAEMQLLPMEVRLAQLREPVAIQGVVENGVVRPVDSTVQLREKSRVLIITVPSVSAG